MTPKTQLVFGLACAVAVSTAALPASAGDFFHDVQRTFDTDIPHFFQDDIPCAFGGQPTSHTKSSCNDRPARRPVADRERDHDRAVDDRERDRRDELDTHPDRPYETKKAQEIRDLPPPEPTR